MCEQTGLLVGYKATQGHGLRGSSLSNFAFDASSLAGLGDLGGQLSGSSGGSSAGGGGLSGLGSVITSLGGSGGGSSSGGIGSALGGIGSMALTGASIGGPWGAAAGAAVGLITNMGAIFGSHGTPDHERPDLIKIAAANDITEDQASWVCGYEESHSPRNYDDICAQAANDKNYFQQLLRKYNNDKPNEKIVPKTAQVQTQYTQLQAQVAQGLAGSGVPSPIANLSLADAQQQAAATGMTLEAYLKAMLNAAGAKVQAAQQQSAQQQTIQQQVAQQQMAQQLVAQQQALGIAPSINPAIKLASAASLAGATGATGTVPEEVEKDHTLLYVAGGCGAVIVILLVVMVLKNRS